jgi:hypothetical protein
MNSKQILEITMRTAFRAVFLTAFLALASFANAQPQLAKPPKSGVGVCKNRCKVQYNFCKSHATTKLARKSCAATRKTCKGQCGG